LQRSPFYQKEEEERKKTKETGMYSGALDSSTERLKFWKDRSERESLPLRRKCKREGHPLRELRIKTCSRGFLGRGLGRNGGYEIRPSPTPLTGGAMLPEKRG